jgi:hypothetical protein
MKLFLLLASLVGLVDGQGMLMGAPMDPYVSSMDYVHQGVALQGFLALPDSFDANNETLPLTPAVIIIP